MPEKHSEQVLKPLKNKLSVASPLEASCKSQNLHVNAQRYLFKSQTTSIRLGSASEIKDVTMGLGCTVGFISLETLKRLENSKL